MHCLLKIRGTSIPFYVTIVYGENSDVKRRELWSGLRKAKVLMGNKPWMLMGDFNAMLFPHDGFGGSSRRNLSMDEFYNCVEDIEVFDARYSGVHYMWTQKPRGEVGILRKLDRIMVNTEFMDYFRNSVASFQP